MLPRSTGRMAGKSKIYGNIIGGLVTIVFYEILTIVPNFFFFIIVFLGIAMIFAEIVFAGKSYSGLFKTGFSTLTLIIGSTTNSTDNAANEIWIRIFQVMLSVLYVVGAYYLWDAFLLKKTYRRKHFNKPKIIVRT
jgi:membrane-bound ClpP family serine protease